jgi:hypothetical protein
MTKDKGRVNLEPDDYEFFGVYCKNKLMDVKRWSPSLAHCFGQPSRPPIHVFDWKPADKQKWVISRIKITEDEI